MEPVPRKLATTSTLTLRNLILVMRKGQVLTTTVQVESIAQIFLNHGRALEMPTRAPRPPRTFPKVVAISIALPLPENKVRNTIFLVFIRQITRPLALGFSQI